MYLTMSALTNGEPAPASLLIERVKGYAWRPTLTLLSRVAAVIVNAGGSASRDTVRVTLGELAKYPASTTHEEHIVALVRRHLATRRAPTIVAHDAVIYFLQALVLLHGSDAGRTPSLAELAFLMLVANDHLDGQRSGGTRSEAPSLEDLVTILCHERKFNSQRDLVPAMARTALMFEQPPDDRLAPGDPSWLAIQRAAFDGLTFAEYYERYICPLVLVSSTWGGLTDAEAVEPLLQRGTWLSNTAVPAGDGQRFLDELSMERDEIAKAVRVRADGLPERPTIFFRSPFVRLNEETSACLSPRLIREFLEMGIWARFRGAAQSSGKSSHWLRQFGIVFELWARRVARGAGALDARLASQLVISERIGTEEEVEDIVVRDARNAVLFSIKGAVLRENVAHDASAEETIAWYERFLFAPRDPKKGRADHAGAVVKLNDKIELIRDGTYDQVDRDVYILPVIVTYGSLHDNPALYTWIDKRCRDLGLLRDGGTWPLCLATIDDLEYLMAMGARGQDVIQVLRNKPVTTWVKRNLDALLYACAGRDSRLRLPFLEDAYEEVTDRSIRRLFPDGRRASRSPAR